MWELKEIKYVKGLIHSTRQEPGIISDINKGFASLAKATKCNVLPVGIIGTEVAKRIPFSGNIIVKIGEVIPYSDDIDSMIEQWGKSLESLTGFEYRSSVQQKD